MVQENVYGNFCGISLNLLGLLMNCTYPSWKSPMTMKGNFIIGNEYGIFTWCYDGSGRKMGKHTRSQSNDSHLGEASLIYLDTDFYMICNEGPCSHNLTTGQCQHFVAPQFPFALNQFENYTNVGIEIVNNKTAYHWVGINSGYGYGSFAQDQYFDYNNPCTVPIGNIYIDQPKPNTTETTTEIFWIQQIQPGVDPNCFVLSPNCSAT
eukprot:158276_1